MKESYQSETGVIKQLVVKHARDAFVSDDVIGRQWRELHYPGPPDLARAVAEYDGFIRILEGFDIDIRYLPGDPHVGLDSLYTRDASVVCDNGLILCNMGKAERCLEPAAGEDTYRSMGVPVCGAITGGGNLEGGDVVWIDERTMAVGLGYRTNQEGIRQLQRLVGSCADELIVVPLPHWRGPGGVFHLMSILSPIDRDLALVYSPLMPVPFRQTLLARGMTLIEVPESEFESLGGNVLAVAPRKCVMLAGNPRTRRRLEEAGAEIFEFQGSEISVKGAGGPTCLTRPTARLV